MSGSLAFGFSPRDNRRDTTERERIYIIRKEYPETANDRWVLTPQTRAEVLDHLSGEPGVPVTEIPRICQLGDGQRVPIHKHHLEEVVKVPGN